MSDGLLKSYAFRREREPTWRELDDLIKKVESKGLRALSPDQIHRLPLLYRATLSSLSVARGISLDRNVLEFLESLSTRAYLSVYGARGNALQAIYRFLFVGFPGAVRQAGWHLVAAIGLIGFGVLVGFLLTADQPDWYYTFVSEDLAAGRVPTADTEFLREGLYKTDSSAIEMLHVFAASLFTHNAGIGILCFALGVALGLPVVYLLFTNGAMLGAMAALYADRGLAVDFWAWILVHGTTELLAIILCAAAGLMLGSGIILPGRRTRLDNLARQGRVAARIVLGAVLMFLVAGLLEGFARQLVTDPLLRYLIGGGALLIWIVYFRFSGRGAGDGEGR